MSAENVLRTTGKQIIVTFARHNDAAFRNVLNKYVRSHQAFFWGGAESSQILAKKMRAREFWSFENEFQYFEIEFQHFENEFQLLENKLHYF